MKAIFQNRREAGRALAQTYATHFSGRPAGAVVFALPRGGVPVAYEIAVRHALALDVLTVRKLGFPGHEEWAAGAMAADGTQVLNPDAMAALVGREGELERVVARETVELARRERQYRGDRPPLAVAGLATLLVDDGIATGTSLRAAVRALRRRDAGRVTVAAPVGSPDTCDALRDEADEVLCLHTPDDFRAVGAYYVDFSPVSDGEVVFLLSQPTTRHGRN